MHRGWNDLDMKSALAALMLGVWVATPCPAGERVAEMRVSRRGSNLNLRITARNPDPQTRGPVKIALFARHPHWGPWLPIKIWKPEHALPPHHKVCRDFFDDNSLLLRILAEHGKLEVKAVVSAPSLWGVVERTLVP